MSWKPTVRNVAAFFVGALVSIPANFLLLGPLGQLLGSPDPPTASPMEEPDVWKQFIQSLTPLHLLGPLIAHWNGAFSGALAASLIAVDRRVNIPLYVAAFVMLGGVANAFMLPGQPKLFLAIDLAGYIPFGYVGWFVAQSLRKSKRS